jgi:hypothetical protein
MRNFKSMLIVNNIGVIDPLKVYEDFGPPSGQSQNETVPFENKNKLSLFNKLCNSC